MTARSPLPPAANPSTALGAFLRGVERRALLFAELQCGDPASADAALRESLDGFVAVAARHPVADWPQLYWALLLAAPSLRVRPGAARWPEAFAHLAMLGRGPRAALLLGLVAGLPEAGCAAALGVAQPTYRLALQRALPRDSRGRPDVAVWQSLDRAARQALQALPSGRLLSLARSREAALSGHGTASTARAEGNGPGTARRQDRPVPPGWVLPVLRVALGLCAAGLAASFVWPEGWNTGGHDRLAIRASPLPEAAVPAARFGGDIALSSHPDFEQLADPGDAAVIDALDFYAWYAAGLQARPATPGPRHDAAPRLPEPRSAGLETEDADAQD